MLSKRTLSYKGESTRCHSPTPLIGEKKKWGDRGLAYTATHNLPLTKFFLTDEISKISLPWKEGTPPTPSPARSLCSLTLPPVPKLWLLHWHWRSLEGTESSKGERRGGGEEEDKWLVFATSHNLPNNDI